MNPDLVEILELELQKKKPKEVDRCREFLQSLGFSRPIGIKELEGKVLATYLGTAGYDFLFYPVASFTPESEGVAVHQEHQKSLHAKLSQEQELEAIQREGLELFVPYHLVESGIFIGSQMPAYIEAEDNMGLIYPKKEYSAEEIESLEPGMLKLLRGIVESKKMPNLSDMGNSIASEARNNNIPVIGVKTRAKTPESIFSRIEARKVNYDEAGKIPDINGVRFIVEGINGCYRLLDRLDRQFHIIYCCDLISVPKTNGFQALIARPRDESLSLEFQIQTPKMELVAAHGSGANYRIPRHS